MPKLLVRSEEPDSRGRVLHITPQSAGWKYIGFSVYRLRDGEDFSGGGDEREYCLVILSGRASVAAGGKSFEGVGARNNVFDGPPTAVYIPGGVRYRVRADGPLQIAVCSAPGGGDYDVRLIAPGEYKREVRGKGTNTRYVQDILPDSAPAHSLLVVEVVTPGGHWSSYPPHKHDRDSLPLESALEETYYHRLNPPQGFAFQRVYTDDRSIDETMSVEDGDCVMVPRGYHPVGAPHGYDLYYLNVMAGPVRKWVFKNDPQHEWMLAQS